MPPLVRNIAATLAGLVAGSVANMAIVQLNTMLHPMPPGIDPNDLAQFGEYVATLPSIAFVVTMFAHLSQALIGGWVAARLAATLPLLLAMIVGGLSMIGGLVMLNLIPHPTWMWLEIPLYLAAAWFVGQAETRRRAGGGSNPSAKG